MPNSNGDVFERFCLEFCVLYSLAVVFFVPVTSSCLYSLEREQTYNESKLSSWIIGFKKTSTQKSSLVLSDTRMLRWEMDGWEIGSTLFAYVLLRITYVGPIFWSWQVFANFELFCSLFVFVVKNQAHLNFSSSVKQLIVDNGLVD